MAWVVLIVWVILIVSGLFKIAWAAGPHLIEGR